MIVDLELKVPLNINGLTLKQYQKYLKVLEVNKDVEKGNDFLNLKALEIFCGIDLEYAHKLPLYKFDDVLKQIDKCFREETPLERFFSLTGTDGVTVEFGFITKLDDMTYGEFDDLQAYIGDWDMMHKAMAILYRPVLHKDKHTNYRIADYGGTDAFGEAMKDMPLGVALGAMVFFYRLGTKLSVYTMDSTMKELEKEGSYQVKKHLTENGVDIKQYMHWLKEMSEELTTLPRFQYTTL